MNVLSLLNGIEYSGIVNDAEISFVTDDSRKVEKGCAFVCCKGGSFDGHTFAEKAAEIGAQLIVCERDMGVPNQIIVADSKKAYALLCANFFGNPSRKMKMIGITGTNGKTTSTYLIKDILQQQGKKVGLIGTIQNMIGDQDIPAKYTTPQAWELNVLLSQMYKSGCEYVVMEVSSMALVQQRLYGIEFDVAVFTNLTQDHLDYHKTMEEYFKAKCILFENSKNIIINADDEYGRRIAQQYKDSDKNVVTFSLKDDSADCTAKNIQLSGTGSKFIMVSCGSINRVEFSMPGEYSVQNAIGSALACQCVGFDIADICANMKNIKGVKGRCEVLVKEPFTVICDYAHTPDGLENVLSGLKPFAQNRFIVLYGCAGERDPKKRRYMSEAVAKYADFAVLTSDNPRGENPQSIIDDAVGGLIENKIPYIAEVDRRKAIKMALDMLQYNDILILCGKGHEDYQVIDKITLYLDEHRIVEEYMKKRNEK
ncbi:MAG: UDP-N-acetylmuramoyl-L-alanyl-D-glutamate--2,6-diaminopimelate ligase [Oscillospiraceae bacterium]|nr:UDP-N-acetylmuramoyl-L-alanyl-D-glutamate--2,6-diaminopimelate ligase [Oscillospiraceae bacterium]